jgi:hypothetical protein
MPENGTKSDVFKIELPLRVRTGKTDASKWFILNLNNYRGAHHMLLSKSKDNYCSVVETALDIAKWPEVSQSGPLVAFWTLFPPTRTRLDLENPLPIISKFTMDALVTFKVIPDDDYKTIRKVIYDIGTVDKENPRAVLELIPFHSVTIKKG